MIEFVLSLPEGAGIAIAMVFATLLGLAVYIISHSLISKYQKEDLKDPMSSLFRVVGVLVGLMLSLAFADVIIQVTTIKKALEREAVAISDTFRDLKQFEPEKTRKTRSALIEYTRAVIDDDWPALADDRLGQRAGDLMVRLSEKIANLEPQTPVQKRVLSRIDADIDVISDARLIRLDNALAAPPVYIYVIIFGFLVTMACFGAYRPQAPLVVLVSLYTSFVGLVLYLILSLSDPFQGAFGVDPTTLEYILERMRNMDAKSH